MQQSLMESVKTIADKSSDFKQLILSGDVAVLPTLTAIKKALEVCKRTIEDAEVMDAAMRELSLYGVEERKKGVTIADATLRVKEAGVKYDYSECGSREWEQLTKEIDEATELRKEVEKHLKALPYKGVEIVDENGEVTLLCPPAKSSKTIIEFNFTKK